MFACLIVCILIVVSLVVIFTVTSRRNRAPKEAILRWNKTGITVVGLTGLPGNAADQLNLPNGLAFDWEHSLYVADSGNNRVQRYLRGSSRGTTVCGETNGTSGNSPSQLSGARKIAVMSNKDIYMSDRYNNRVQLWPFGSTSGRTIAGTNFSGTGNHQLNSPQGINIDLTSNVLYIADTGNSRVMRYVPNASSGDVVAGIIGCGMNRTHLCKPTGLYYDPTTNTIITCNYQQHNVVSWKIGSSEWTHVAGSISMTSGNSSTEFNGPEGLGVDPMQNIYIADKDNHRVQFFPFGQSNGTTIAGITGVSGNNSVLLSHPFEVQVDSQLNLYVSDTNNHRVQKFLRY